MDRDYKFYPRKRILVAFIKDLEISLDLSSYMKNPVLLLNNEHHKIVGKALRLEWRKKGLWGEFYIGQFGDARYVTDQLKKKHYIELSCGYIPTLDDSAAELVEISMFLKEGEGINDQ